ncbi:MAG: hypothetical protein Q8Q08_09815 [Candidatus Omnitrophota bacterium]|nr:hypothetical protein [Candidatus Omnitrophota bacterium]
MGLRIFAAFFLMAAWAGSSAVAGEDTVLHARAQKEAKEGQSDYAYLHYQAILRDYPRSRFSEPALFAVGEYYFFLPSTRSAKEAFSRFVGTYPDSEARLFALAYLLKIAYGKNDAAEIKALSNAIVNLKQVSLVFRDFKEFSYRSPMDLEHKAVFRIDRIEFFIGGKIFVELTY